MKLKSKQGFILHKVKELKINFGVVIGKSHPDDNTFAYIETGGIEIPILIEIMEQYLDKLKADVEYEKPEEPGFATTEALPFAITREALEDDLFEDIAVER